MFWSSYYTYQGILFLVPTLEVSIVFKCIIITIIKGKLYFLIETQTTYQSLLYLALIMADIQEVTLDTFPAFWPA